MKRIKTYFAVLMIVLAFPVHAIAELSNGEKPDRGWFWYEVEPDPKPKKEALPPEPSKTEKKQEEKPVEAREEKKPMTVAWLRKILPELEERAIDDPSRENLSAYFYAKRVMLDKSQRFTDAGKNLIAADPMLDENNRVPFSTYGKNAFLNKEYESKQEALKYLGKNVGGLFVFFESTCIFCKVQMTPLENMSKQLGFNVKYVSVDGHGLPGMKEWENDNGHAKMLDIKIYPTTVLAVPPSTYLIVSQGMMAEDQLEERILTAAQNSNLLPPEMVKNLDVWNRGVLTTEDMNDGAFSKPEDFVKYVKDKLKDRY